MHRMEQIKTNYQYFGFEVENLRNSGYIVVNKIIIQKSLLLFNVLEQSLTISF